jgi:hypothetical protein
MESMRDTSVEMPGNGGDPSKVIHCRLNLALPKSIPSILLWAIFSYIDLNSYECKYGNSRIGPFQSETQYLTCDVHAFVEWKLGGNAVTTPLPHSIRLVSSSDRFKKISGDRAETLLLHCRLFPITYLQRGHKIQWQENRSNLY